MRLLLSLFWGAFIACTPVIGPFRFRWNRGTTLVFCFVALLIGKPLHTFSGSALAQTARRDAIAELLATPPAASRPAGQTAETQDPRSGDVQFEQAKQFMASIDSVLRDAADSRSSLSKLPGRDEFFLPPLWRETREDRSQKVRALLDNALAIVTDVPVVEIQKKIDGLRRNIHDLEDQTAKLKEKQLIAPKDAALAGVLSDTVASLEAGIAENNKRIDQNRSEIKAAKGEIGAALKAAGVNLESSQIDLLIDSVLSGDLVRLVSVFNAAKLVDGQLAKLVGATGENMAAARKYFAMHAALFAMLVQAQDTTIAKIDSQYLPKLDAVIADIKAAQGKTGELLKADNRPDQKRALDANSESQKIASEAAKAYRRYLVLQRDQLNRARLKAVHDLKIADNTYETVEASVQLRNLMKESAASFEAVQRLEAPSFEQIFKNEELRKEFEDLTRRLDTPAS